MQHIDKIYRLHNWFTSARHPIHFNELQERFGDSKRTIYRLLDFLRDRLNAPLEFKRGKGWYYREDQRGIYALPGFWLNDQEIYALLTMQHLLGSFDPQLLQHELAPFKRRITEILNKTTGHTGTLSEFIHLLPYNRRENQYACFQLIASACLQHQQLRVTYHNRSQDEREVRILSPQMLIYYRDNWYLGAYCHNKNELHPFSLDRITEAETLSALSKTIPQQELETVFFSTFGIFSGHVQAVAVLQFTAEAARWVAGVTWHKAQEAAWQTDGSYVLRIPYSSPIELVGEILRFADGVTVLEPPTLREMVREKLQKMVKNYE